MMNVFKYGKSLIHRWMQPCNCGKIGANARIALPRRIRGNRNIFIGDRTAIDAYSWIEAIQSYGDVIFNPRIIIGDEVQIGRYSTITSIDEIKIEDGCLFSEYIYISDHAHDVFTQDFRPLVRMPLIKKGKVHIGRQCFLGFRSIIMPGVTLGDRCIVGAGAVVTKSFPSKSVLAGVPAKLIRTNM